MFGRKQPLHDSCEDASKFVHLEERLNGSHFERLASCLGPAFTLQLSHTPVRALYLNMSWQTLAKPVDDSRKGVIYAFCWSLQ